MGSSFIGEWIGAQYQGRQEVSLTRSLFYLSLKPSPDGDGRKIFSLPEQFCRDPASSVFCKKRRNELTVSKRKKSRSAAAVSMLGMRLSGKTMKSE
jgi:hypothetical protein